MQVSVSYKQICPDVAPANLLNDTIGIIKDGIFIPYGSVAKFFFFLQREKNLKNKKKRTNVYFIQSVYGGLVKIGSAKDVNKRLKILQTGSPVPLVIIKIYKDVDSSFEYELHNQFKQYRKYGEWFDESVLKEI